ncbi:hypothetical protein D3C73_1558450 [compost metagenome]
MNRMAVLPLGVRAAGEDSGNRSDNSIRLTVPKEGLVAAIMKNDKCADEKACCGNA